MALAADWDAWGDCKVPAVGSFQIGTPYVGVVTGLHHIRLGTGDGAGNALPSLTTATAGGKRLLLATFTVTSGAGAGTYLSSAQLDSATTFSDVQLVVGGGALGPGMDFVSYREWTFLCGGASMRLSTDTGPVLSSLAIHAYEDSTPHTTDVIPWGIEPPASNGALLANVTGATSLGSLGDGTYNVHARFYDPTHNLEGPADADQNVVISGGGGNGSITLDCANTGQANVTKVRVYAKASTAAAYTLAGTFVVNSTANRITSVGTAAEDTDAEPGPMIGDGDDNVGTGGYATGAILQNRVIVGGSPAVYGAGTSAVSKQNEIAYSALDKPHYFAHSNRIQIAPDDGDYIVAMRTLFDRCFIFKRRSIHVLTGAGPNSFSVDAVSLQRGTVAKRSVVPAGDKIYFLSSEGVERMDAAGNIQTISGPIRPMIEGCTKTALGNACAVYWKSRRCYLLALPGLQAQVAGGAGPGQTVNDGVLVYHEDTDQWEVWLGIYASSMCVGEDENGQEYIFYGDYWGGVHEMDVAFNRDRGVSTLAAATYTVSSSTTTVITVTSASGLVTSSSDASLVGQMVWVVDDATSGSGAAGQARMITASDATAKTITVSPAFTTAPAANDFVVIGPIPWSIETGDMSFGDLNRIKRVEELALSFDAQVDITLNIDAAVDGDDIGKTTNTLSYAETKVDVTSDTVDTVRLPYKAGRTQRLRLTGYLHDTAIGGATVSRFNCIGMIMRVIGLGKDWQGE